MFEFKPDFEKSQKRMDAFLQGYTIDRPVILGIVVPKEKPTKVPEKKYDTYEKQWKDIEFRALREEKILSNYHFLADTMPYTFPNMGPEIFSAWCGCGYNYGENTTWSEPCIHDWEEDYDKAVLDPNHELLKLTIDFQKLLSERGRGKFITGITDLHPGGDHIAALRDPQELCIDMIENLDYVKKKLADSYVDYKKVFNKFYEITLDYELPCTSWMGVTSSDKFYIPSNDFSCMISKEMFDDVFLEGIKDECDFYKTSIYHLDGPGALTHLESLMSIEKLGALQWVPGAGNEGFSKWVKVYKRVQKAKKGIWIDAIEMSELDQLFAELKPDGVCIAGIKDVKTKEDYEYALKRIEKWE